MFTDIAVILLLELLLGLVIKIKLAVIIIYKKSRQYGKQKWISQKTS
jgi:hypothetical protein